MSFRLASGPRPAGRADAWVILGGGPGDLPPLAGRMRGRVRVMASSAEGVQRFEDRPGHVALWPTWGELPADHVVVAGLGEARPPAPVHLRKAAAAVARRLRATGWRRIAVFAGFPLDADLARAFALGWTEGGYEFVRFRNRDQRRPAATVVVHAGDGRAAGLARALEEGEILGRTVNEVRDIANLPGNELPPLAVARHARALARRCGLRCRVLGPAALARLRCRALLAVGRGSRRPPCVIVLEYRGRGRRRPPVALVGKTITFDSGGLSLKTAKGMEWMKYDKSGGMAVLAAVAAAARLRLPQPVTAFLACAENMPGGDATRPGDIVVSRSGSSIEILNTDAEGRLVLADALALAADRKPRAVVDLATLTGAAITAVGTVVSAVLGDDDMRAALFDAGERTGERLWPLPLYPEYREMLNSPFAEIRNIGDGTAGTIAGGMFLRHFVPRSLPWGHIDLTRAWEERHQPHAAAGATLFGAALLIDWIRSLKP